MLPSNLYNKETVSSINESSQDDVCSQGQKTTEQETSAEGLILKELPSHLKNAFLEPEKRKPIIISVALTESEEKKLLEILMKYKEAIAWSIEDLKVLQENKNVQKGEHLQSNFQSEKRDKKGQYTFLELIQIWSLIWHD